MRSIGDELGMRKKTLFLLAGFCLVMQIKSDPLSAPAPSLRHLTKRIVQVCGLAWLIMLV